MEVSDPGFHAFYNRCKMHETQSYSHYHIYIYIFVNTITLVFPTI